MRANKKNVVDGNVDVIKGGPVGDDEIKIRITTWIDSDVLHHLKKEADERKIGYQTILNQKLRRVVLGDADPLGERVEKLEKTVQQLKKRVG